MKVLDRLEFAVPCTLDCLIEMTKTNIDLGPFLNYRLI